MIGVNKNVIKIKKDNNKYRIEIMHYFYIVKINTIKCNCKPLFSISFALDLTFLHYMPIQCQNENTISMLKIPDNFNIILKITFYLRKLIIFSGFLFTTFVFMLY